MRPQKYQKFPLFGKESPRRGDSLDRFRKFSGAFIRLTILRQCFKFHVIHFTKLLRRNRASVNQGKFFRTPCMKNYTLDRKMNVTFFDGYDELSQHAIFGEGRTTRAGCRCENVLLFFVGHALSPLLTYLTCVRRVHSSNKHCVTVYCPISMRFSGDSSFRDTIQISYSSLGGAAIFTKLRSKIAKSLKIGGKVCAHHVVQIADDLKKFHRSRLFFSLFVRGPDVLSNALNVSQLCRQVAPQYSQIYGGNFQKTQKSAAELCQILRMVTVEIVINYTRVMGVHVSISCRYALSFMGGCFCFQPFQNGQPFQLHYIVLIFSLGGATSFVKLWSKIAKSPKISGKVCAHDFVQITERF